MSVAAAQRADLYDIDTLQKVSFTFKQANWKTLLQSNYATRTYIRCDVDINGQLFKDAGVRYRGASTYLKLPVGSEKQPYKIKLDEFVAGQKYRGYGTLNLSNNLFDPTWVREPVGYFLCRQFMAAPKSNYATLRINNVDFGPFVNTQQMNKSFLREHFPSDDGNRYKPSWSLKVSPNDRALTYLGATTAPYQAAFEIKNENAAAPYVDLIALTNALNNSAASITSVLPRFMDVDNAIRMNACDVTLLRLDSYIGPICHNYFMYHEEVHDRFQFFPQDTNNFFSFSVSGKGISGLATTPLYYMLQSLKGLRPLQSKLLAVPAWKNRYVAHARNCAPWLDWSKLKPVVDRFQAVIAKAAAADPKRLYPHSAFTSNLTSTYVDATTKFSVFGIKPVVDARKAFLATLPEFKEAQNTISNLRLTPSKPTSQSSLQFTVKALPPTARSIDKVKLHWRVTGAYREQQLFDDGQHGDGQPNDGVFGFQLPAQTSGYTLDYYVESTVANGGPGSMNFLPSTATFQPRSVYIDHPRGGPALRINEFMARNASTIKDNANEFEDWLEIYNSTNAAISVSGMYLTDNPRNPIKWKLPLSQSIPAKKSLLVWCDNDTTQGPLHASFKLDGDGEWIGLFDTDGKTLVDDVRFGGQAIDVSIGRISDAAPLWVSFQDPSPMVANNMKDRTTPCGNLRFSNVDPFAHVATLTASQLPKLASTVTLSVDRSAPNSAALLLLGFTQSHIPFWQDQVLLAGFPIALLLPQFTNAAGQVALPLSIPDDSGLLGSEITFQSIAVTPQIEFVASNALIMRFCPK